ncbi:hypothetical protein TNCT_281991 [Trichonephila clavata]|uniref:Uncharacterized protein n=1 Tax=Trichonephila clavata TaxID=2740835 RepID=A0A8X6KNC0_TRICU|nr:hypothetical protein TNCT_281991 [Trichonephila clavata]
MQLYKKGTKYSGLNFRIYMGEVYVVSVTGEYLLPILALCRYYLAKRRRQAYWKSMQRDGSRRSSPL